MAPQRMNLLGNKFDKLTVIGTAPDRITKSGAGVVYWKCRCECNNLSEVATSDLRGGKVKQCKDCARKAHGEKIATHGGTGTKLYSIWRSMKNRCYNPNEDGYNWYGGKGITICDEWLHDFEAFQDWALNNGYKDHLTIDRESESDNYEPSKCEWKTQFEQNNHKSNTHGLTFEEALNLPYYPRKVTKTSFR